MDPPDPAPVTRCAVRGVAEVVLNVRDLPAMVAFYAGVLGFRAFEPDPVAGVPSSVAPDEGKPTIVFLRIGSVETLAARPGAAHAPLLVLIDPARHASVAGRFGDPSPATSTLNHLAFDFDEADYEPEADRLGALGIEVRRVAFAWMGAKALFFADPEGNTIELICRDGAARRPPGG